MRGFYLELRNESVTLVFVSFGHYYLESPAVSTVGFLFGIAKRKSYFSNLKA